MSLDDSSKRGFIGDPDKAALTNVGLPCCLESHLYREQTARSVRNVTRLYNFEEREESLNLAGEEVGEDILLLQRELKTYGKVLGQRRYLDKSMTRSHLYT